MYGAPSRGNKLCYLQVACFKCVCTLPIKNIKKLNYITDKRLTIIIMIYTMFIFTKLVNDRFLRSFIEKF